MSTKTNMLSYLEAQAWNKENNIVSGVKWGLARKNERIPENMPKDPYGFYKKQGKWISWGDFLGTGKTYRKNFCSYAEAKKWVQAKKITNQKDWQWNAHNEKEWPLNMPRNPYEVYRKTGEWKNWEDFFGMKGSQSSRVELSIKKGLGSILNLGELYNRDWITLATGKKYSVDMVDRKLKIVIEYDGAKWHLGREEKDELKAKELEAENWAVIRIREFPLDILNSRWNLSVDRIKIRKDISSALIDIVNHIMLLYSKSKKLTKKCEKWLKSPPELGYYNNLRTRHKFKDYNEAKLWVKEQKITKNKDYRLATKRVDWPPDMPKDPPCVYGYRGKWKSWGDFLGTGYVHSTKRVYASYEDAAIWAKKSNIKTRDEWEKSNIREDIPRFPYEHYGKEFMNNGGWRGFLGNEGILCNSKNFVSYDEASAWAKKLV